MFTNCLSVITTAITGAFNIFTSILDGIGGRDAYFAFFSIMLVISFFIIPFTGSMRGGKSDKAKKKDSGDESNG